MVESKTDTKHISEEEPELETLLVAPGEMEVKLTSLDIKLKTSLEDRQKYQVIFDNTGECEVFFRYKAHMVDLHKLMLSVNLGKITKDEAIEQLRRALVYSMRIGDRFVLNCGKLNIDLKLHFNDPVNFPIDLIFEFEEWRKDEVYKRIVRQEEDVDLMGNKKCYWMNETFDIIVLRDITRDNAENDKREEFKKSIPHFSNSFETLFVSRKGTKEDQLKAQAKAQPFQPQFNGHGMNVVTFGKNNNVTHQFHSFDYADIYDPVRKPKMCNQSNSQAQNKFASQDNYYNGRR